VNKVKDSYYFSHDANARNDIKISALRQDYGWAGYGIYFGLIEVLREQSDNRLKVSSISRLAFQLNADTDLLQAVIHNYELFVLDGDFFYSARLCRSVDEYNAKKIRYQEAGRKGGEASVKHRLSNAQALKERKVNKIKGNENTGTSAKRINNSKNFVNE
jgi:hypothetical protein